MYCLQGLYVCGMQCLQRRYVRRYVLLTGAVCRAVCIIYRGGMHGGMYCLQELYVGGMQCLHRRYVTRYVLLTGAVCRAVRLVSCVTYLLSISELESQRKQQCCFIVGIYHRDAVRAHLSR